jgi:ppGpp synthetase/RelA/SpoT-type nucleotidyltranferase
MPWTKPLSSKNRIDTAGDIISGRKPPTPEISMDVALDISGNWRSSHGYPLHVAWTSLRTRARAIDSSAIVPKRLKRLPSVAAKLKRFENMQLSKMQDLGGCRAVLSNVRKVDELVKLYEGSPSQALEFVKKFDYIRDNPGPKEDGYRSVHLVYKYQGNCQEGAYKGLKVEIQIRSRRQHAWATALEIIDTFTNQKLKSNFGDESWKRFFALVSSAMAMAEKRPVVPNTPTDRTELIAEVRALCDKLNIPNVFLGLATGIQLAPTIKFEKPSVKAETYILSLDSQKRISTAIAFANNKFAEETLLKMEKDNLENPHIQSVMVSAESLRGLREAYPNYYLDTRRFVTFVESLLAARPAINLAGSNGGREIPAVTSGSQ